MQNFLPQRSQRAQRTPCFQHSVFSVFSVANLCWFGFLDFAILLPTDLFCLYSSDSAGRIQLLFLAR